MKRKRPHPKGTTGPRQQVPARVVNPQWDWILRGLHPGVQDELEEGQSHCYESTLCCRANRPWRAPGQSQHATHMAVGNKGKAMAHNKKYRKAKLPCYVMEKESKRLKEVGMRWGL